MLLRFMTPYEDTPPSFWETFMTTPEKIIYRDRVQSADSLLAPESLQRQLNILRQLISVTDKGFDRYYAPLIKRTAQWMQLLPSPTEEKYKGEQGLFSFSLARAIAALKYRRVYMLPIGADAETCYQQQEVWTYALFTAALLKDATQVLTHFAFEGIGKEQKPFDYDPLEHTWILNLTYQWQVQKPLSLLREVSAALLKQLMPEAGLTWLQQDRYPLVAKYWYDYLNQQTLTDNFLIKIISNAEAALLGRSPVSAVHVVATSNKSAAENSAPPENVSTLNTSEADLTLSITRWLTWIKQALQQRVLLFNTEHSFIHVVKEGIFVRLPELYDFYVAAQEQRDHLSDKPYEDRRWVTALAQHGAFIANPNRRDFLHRYYQGSWENRQSWQGLLINPDVLMDNRAVLDLHPHLQRDVT